MFNRKKKNLSPGAQASRAQSNIFVRIVGCGFLIYIMKQLITSEEFNTKELWKVALVVLLGLAAVFIIVITAIELIRNIKKGAYSAKYYEPAEAPEENEDATNETEIIEIEAGEVIEELDDSEDPPASE